MLILGYLISGWQDDDAIKWKHFPHYWHFVRGIHRSPGNSPQKDQWRGALMFSFICAWINGRVNNRKAGDLRRHHAHYDVTVMQYEVMTDSLIKTMNNVVLLSTMINSSPPCAAYMRQWIGSASVQIMACRLFGAKPLSEPMLGYCQLDP